MTGRQVTKLNPKQKWQKWWMQCLWCWLDLSRPTVTPCHDCSALQTMSTVTHKPLCHTPMLSSPCSRPGMMSPLLLKFGETTVLVSASRLHLIYARILSCFAHFGNKHSERSVFHGFIIMNSSMFKSLGPEPWNYCVPLWISFFVRRCESMTMGMRMTGGDCKWV
jgi:hypothetical protein